MDEMPTGGGGTITPKTANAASRLVKKLCVYLKNHFPAKAIINAAVLKHQLGMPVAGDYSREFVERYPEVTGIISRESPPRSLLSQG